MSEGWIRTLAPPIWGLVCVRCGNDLIWLVADTDGSHVLCDTCGHRWQPQRPETD